MEGEWCAFKSTKLADWAKRALLREIAKRAMVILEATEIHSSAVIIC